MVAAGEGDAAKLAAARAIASRYLAKEPGHAQALFVRGWAAQRQGDPSSALADYRRLFESIGELAKYAHFNIAVILESRGESQEAVEHLVACVQVDPSLDYAWARAARILARLDRFEEAKIMVEQGLEASPGSAELRALDVELKARETDEPAPAASRAEAAPAPEPEAARSRTEQRATPQTRRGAAPSKQGRGKKRH